jgi:hypothetical protein
MSKWAEGYDRKHIALHQLCEVDRGFLLIIHVVAVGELQEILQLGKCSAAYVHFYKFLFKFKFMINLQT